MITPISLKIYFTKINNALEYIFDLNIYFTWIYTLPEHIFYLNIWTYILLLEFSYLGVNVILNWCYNKARHGICCSLGYLWKSFRFRFFQTCWKFNSWYNWNSLVSKHLHLIHQLYIVFRTINRLMHKCDTRVAKGKIINKEKDNFRKIFNESLRWKKINLHNLNRIFF